LLNEIFTGSIFFQICGTILVMIFDRLKDNFPEINPEIISARPESD
jgi:hypothetical protein